MGSFNKLMLCYNKWFRLFFSIRRRDSVTEILWTPICQVFVLLCSTLQLVLLVVGDLVVIILLFCPLTITYLSVTTVSVLSVFPVLCFCVHEVVVENKVSLFTTHHE